MKSFVNLGRHISEAIVLLLLGLALLTACGDTTATTAPITTTMAVTTTAPATTAAGTTNPAANSAPTVTSAVTTATPVAVATTRAATTAPATTAAVARPALDVTPPPLGAGESVLKATGFSGEEAKAFLNELSDQVGVRVVGSDGEKKAADWLEKYYKSFGYTQIERQEFPFVSRENRYGAVFTGSRLGGDNGLALGALISKPKSSLTKADMVLYAEGADLKGKLVVMPDTGSLAQQKSKVEASAQAGAAGIILAISSGSSDNKTFENIEVPVILVAANQLPQLKNLSGTEQAKNLTVQATYQAGGNGTGLNVIATRPGPKPDAPVLIFGGHYDTVANTVGASDNGSGTVTTLELAKVLFKQFPDYELRFINFSGEEIGLVGSSFYAAKLTAADKKRITAYVNLDAMGVGERFVAIGTPELVNLAVDTAAKNGIRLEAFNLNNTGAGSDHEAFIKNGVKALMLARWIDPLLHRPGDEPNRVFSEALLLGGGTAILVVQKIIGS